MCQGMNDQQRGKHCKYVQVQKKEGVSKRFAAALHTSALLKSLLLFGQKDRYRYHLSFTSSTYDRTTAE
jgi:hypothetical protein